MSTVDAAGPIALGQRNATMDVLRGWALCGILLMNIPGMGMAVLLNEMPPRPARLDADWIAYAVQTIGFSGAMRGLFTLLFGAGMMVMLRRGAADPSQPASQAFFTRCFALLLLGILNFAVFFWPGEILFNYGVAGLLLYQFRRADLRVILTAAVAILAAMSIDYGNYGLKQAETLRAGETAAAARAAHHVLTPEQTQALQARSALLADAHPTPAAVAEEHDQRLRLPGLLVWSVKFWSKLNFSALAPAFWAESLGFMLLGVALYRLGVLTGERSNRVYLALAAGGFGVGLALRGFQFWQQWATGFDPAPEVLAWQGYAYELGRLPMTLGFVGLVVGLHRAGALAWVAGGLQAIGRLALTNYIGQSAITSALFYGFGLLDRFGFAALMGLCVLIWVAQGLFSLAWLARWEMGPTEWALRSLTYGRLQRLGRTGARAAGAPLPAE